MKNSPHFKKLGSPNIPKLNNTESNELGSPKSPKLGSPKLGSPKSSKLGSPKSSKLGSPKSSKLGSPKSSKLGSPKLKVETNIYSKIYMQITQQEKNSNLLTLLFKFAQSLASSRNLKIYKKLNKSIEKLSFLHDLQFNFLYIFNTISPIIDKKTIFFSLFSNYKNEDMSKIYIRCNLMMGNTIKKEYVCYNFEELKFFILQTFN